MNRLVIHASGLSRSMAIRPDLAENLSNLIELGTFVPLFPVFPVLPDPMRATLFTGRWPSTHGVVGAVPAESPPTPEGIDFEFVDWPGEFKALDARIGELAKGRDVVVIGDGAPQPAKETIEPPAGGASEEQICHVRTGDPAAVVDSMRGVRGAQIIQGAARRAYHVDHANCGDVVLVAPRGARFAGSGPFTRGRLPLSMDDFGVFISTRPTPDFEGRNYILATEVAGTLA